MWAPAFKDIEGEAIMGAHRKIALLSGAALLMLGQPVLAASGSPADNHETIATEPVRIAQNDTAKPEMTAAPIETVIVTAEKRSADVQKVPIAVSAIDGNSLESQSIIGFKELGARVPSLRFGSGVTGGENVITIRGLGSVNTTPGGDSPVAYSVDGVGLQRSTSVDPEFYDIERVEVLRGPQGTLYGRNSVGGSVNVVTNKPGDTLSGSVDAMIGDYAAKTFRGWVNAPLVDDGDFKVYARITGVSAQHNAYSTNLSTSPFATHNQDAQDYRMVRGQVYFEFNPDVNLLISASDSDSRDPVATNTAWWQVPARFVVDQGVPGQPPIPLGSACDFSTEALYNPRVFCREYPENAKNNVQLYSATLNWNFPWATFTSVTGLSSSNVSQTSDGDGSDLPIAFGSAWALRQHQISEEVRLASNDADDPLQWIAGFYYFWSDNYEDFAYSDSGYNDLFMESPPAPLPPGFPGSADTFNFLSHGNTKTRAYAPFGQVDYNLGKTSIGIPLTVTFGIRFSNDEKYGYNYLDYQLPYLCGGSCGPIQGPFSKTWSQWTGKFGLAYQIDDDTMVYASASRGYIDGGNIIGLAHIYNPESAWSYEVGLKSRFLDDRLQLNLAGYHEEIKGLQVFIQSSTQSGINNVDGKTQVNGLEAELTAVPVDNLRLNATLTLTHATYGQYITTNSRFGGPGPGCSTMGPPFLCNFKGNWLNQTPPYALNLGGEYNFDTPIGTITPRADIFFSGKVNFLPDNYPTSTQKAYHQTNLHLTWLSRDGHYSLDGFINNLENADVISNDGLQSVTLGQQVMEPDNFAYYPPRTMGIRFAVKFGG
jgi:iron complex outermembrane receptor protein